MFATEPRAVHLKRERLEAPRKASGGRRRLASATDTPAGAEEAQPSALSAITCHNCGTQNAPAACAEKHITAWLMRLIYLLHERLGGHVFRTDFQSVDAHRRRVGSCNCRFKCAVLLAQSSRWSSLR